MALEPGGEDASGAGDPHLWLEDVQGSAPLAWVKERSAECVAELTADPAFRPLEQRLLAIFDSQERIPLVSKHGPQLYNFWRDAAHERGLWRRTSLAEYRTARPHWDVLLDLDALARDEAESWVWQGAQLLWPDDARALISLSRGGGDAHLVRELDLRTRAFPQDGFALPQAKSQVAWQSRDAIYVGTDFGPGSLTRSGYPRIVKLWKRGTPLAAAQLVYEGEPDDVYVTAGRDFTPGFERNYIYRAPTFFTTELRLQTADGWVRVEKPEDAQPTLHREWLLLRLRSAWTLAGRSYPAGSLLASRLEPWLEGRREIEVLFTPDARRSLQSVSTTRGHLLLTELDQVRSRVAVLSPTAQGWQREPLGALPALTTVSATAADPLRSDEYFLDVTGFLTPSALHLGEVGGGTPEKLRQLPAFFDASGLAVTQHEARSADGTAVPYFQVGPAQPAATGNLPTLLYGYGGFEVSMLPAYSASVGTAWLARGGVYVVANIRGGGEFGPSWHSAARKQHRHRAYEDFAAVAEDLIRRGITRPGRLGAMGGSNGGLLVGNLLTRRPDLVGAIVCQVPLLDMRRYHRLLAGASWMDEYGDPDDPAQWEFIRGFSPYHGVSAKQRYPRVLFVTSTRDDRVHPGHARKMVARMKAQGHDVLYYENTEGGHALAANNAQQAFMSALAFSFLWRQLG
jgi:prolyl oligopeptidase